MKNKIYAIIIILLISIIIGISDIEFILMDLKLMIQILLTLLAISFASYTLIFSPLSKINGMMSKKNNNLKCMIIKFLDSIESNLKTLFFFSMLLIFADFIINYDIPFIKNPLHVDFGIFIIDSLKLFFTKSLTTFCSLNSIIIFYDIMDSSFIILKGSIEKDLEIE